MGRTIAHIQWLTEIFRDFSEKTSQKILWSTKNTNDQQLGSHNSAIRGKYLSRLTHFASDDVLQTKDGQSFHGTLQR
jgi:hypothetical protein